MERAWVGCERRALSARDARGSSQVSFDLYLARTAFLYFSWNGMHPHGAKSILKSIKRKNQDNQTTTTKKGKAFNLDSQEIKYLLDTGKVSLNDNVGK